MYGYIYKTTNLVNGKIYIGQKHSNHFLGSNYLGSGKRLKDAIKHYGANSFKVELLEEISCVEDMDIREIYWINFYNSTNKEIGYNISEGGKVNRTMVGENNPFYGKHHTDDARKKMSEHNNHYMLGKHHKDETKIKISNKNKGKVISQETRERLSLNAKNNPNYGMKGKHPSEETKLKLSQAKLGKPGKAKGKIHITNDIEDKMVYEEELSFYVELGWRKGRKKFSKESCENISKGHIGKTPYNIKHKWINKDIVNKCVKEEELESYLKEGWKIGMYKKER